MEPNSPKVKATRRSRKTGGPRWFYSLLPTFSKREKHFQNIQVDSQEEETFEFDYKKNFVPAPEAEDCLSP